MDEIDIQYMQLALQEAHTAALVGEVPIGAVIVMGNRVVARASNRTIRDTDPTAHAEVVAIRAASQFTGNYRLLEATLYVTLEPCAMCAGAIIQARIPRVVYGADDPKGGAARTCFELLNHPKLNHHAEFTAGVCGKEAAELLQNFFSSRRT